MTEEEQLLNRIARMEAVLEEVKDSIKIISSAITDMVRLDQKHTETSNGLQRAFQAIGKLEERTNAIELALPVLKMTSGWVISGTIAVVALVGTAVVILVLK